MNHPTIRTRYAPSPTGFLHIGGARTALYDYLWAKKHGGQFVLRIEDTDKRREVPGSIEVLKEGLRWLGIQWDEGIEVGGPHAPYVQSERLDLYKKSVQKLIVAKKAYYCFCTPEQLDEMRKEQQQNKQAPRYDRRCRKLDEHEVQSGLSSGQPYVIRLSVPEEGKIVVHEVIRGEIVFDLKDVDDQVLMKSDGYPTYHLANVVDDHEMEITHVMRGEEWIPSTPKHVLLYQAFGWEAPAFAHLTVFLSKQGGKMSKRHGETALLAFRNNGYLPEAIVNYIALLGWNPKTEEEFFTLQELIDRFDLYQVNKGNPIFETEKLDWMNQHYMKKRTAQEAIDYMDYLALSATEHVDLYKKCVQYFQLHAEQKRSSLWKQMTKRCKTFLEVTQALTVLEHIPSYTVSELVWKKSTTEKTGEILSQLIPYVESIQDDAFLADRLKALLIPWITSHGWGNGDVLWPMRFALSGERTSPSPFELAELLGKDETVKRLRCAWSMLK